MHMRSTIITTLLILMCSTPMLAETKTLAPPNLNEAQILIFYKDHLEGVAKGNRLDYDFKSKTGEESFTDKVAIKVADIVGEHQRDLEFNFLSGENHIDFSPAKGYTGNPLIIHFLERDISLMARDTGGSVGYFRNRIRDSFKHPAQVGQVKFNYNGKELTGTKVVVTPFFGDPNAENLKYYAKKRYNFIFSDQVPGGIYRIRTQVPSDKEEEALIDEDMTFQKVVSVTQ